MSPTLRPAHPRPPADARRLDSPADRARRQAKVFGHAEAGGSRRVVARSEPIYYLVAEYDEANSFGAQQWAQWAASWYISTRTGGERRRCVCCVAADDAGSIRARAEQDDKVAGLLTDFCFRHEPDSYARPNRRLARGLRVGFFCMPPAALAVCWALFTPRG